MKSREWIRLVSSLGFLNIVGIVFGFLFQMLVARRFGVSSAMDAYVVAMAIPDVIGSVLFLSTLPTIFIPEFSESAERDGVAGAWRLISALITLLLVIGGIASFVMYFAAPWLIPYFAPGFTPASREIAVHLTRLLFPSILIYICRVSLMVLLQTEGRFAFPQLVVVAFKLMQVVLLYLFSRQARIEFLVFLVWLDGVLVVLSLWMLLPNKGMLRPTWEWSARVRRILTSGVIVTLVGFLGEITSFAYRWFGSFLPAGSISLYFYVSKVVPISVGFTVTVVYKTLLPTLSRLAAQNNLGALRREIRQAYRVALLIIVPMVALLWIGRDAVLGVLFAHSKIQPEQIATASRLILFLLPTIIGGSLIVLPTAVIYAIHRFDVWLYIMAFGVLAIYGLSAVLIPHYGVIGLAMAGSLQTVLSCIATYFLAQRLTVSYSLQQFFPWALRVLLAAACFGFVAHLLAATLVPIHHPFVFPIVEIAVFSVFYPLGLWLLRVPEARDAYAHLLSVLRSREPA